VSRDRCRWLARVGGTDTQLPALARYNFNVPHEPAGLKIACDAMCGGLARWLRVLGVDTSYTPGIEDGTLVQHALAEGRIVISGDGKLFERRLFTTGRVRGLRLPVGLKLLDQLRFTVRALTLSPAFPRCTLCNGELDVVGRAEVGDIVPARSLIWATEYYRCRDCRHVFWEGTHWRRIKSVRDKIAADLAVAGNRDVQSPGQS
jgi:uncharacterized protein